MARNWCEACLVYATPPTQRQRQKGTLERSRRIREGRPCVNTRPLQSPWSCRNRIREWVGRRPRTPCTGRMQPKIYGGAWCILQNWIRGGHLHCTWRMRDAISLYGERQEVGGIYGGRITRLTPCISPMQASMGKIEWSLQR